MTETKWLTAIHYLFTESNGKIVAHCLDLDIISSGSTREEAQEKLNACVKQQIMSCYQEKNYSQLVFQAPDSYWREFDEAVDLPSSVLEIEFQGPTTTRLHAQSFVCPGQLKLEAALCGA